MIHVLTTHLLRLSCLAVVLSVHPASSQTASPTEGAATGAARLRDFESTYEQGLKRIHIPLLSAYFIKLQQLAATSPATDQPAISAELARVQKLISDGGLVDLKSAATLPAPAATPPDPKTPPGAVLVLKPESASDYVATGSASPATLTLGEAEWKVESLEAGDYEIIVLCSIPSFTGTATLTARLAGEEITEDITPDRAARTPDQFRPLRIGRIHLNRNARNEDLQVKLDSRDLPGIQVRQIVIARPRPPPPLN